MLFSIVDRHGEMSGTLRDLIERRVQFSLARFSRYVERVTVVVEDSNGPKGGIDKECRITVNLTKAGTLTVTETDDSIVNTVSRAADRLGHAVARKLDRKKPKSSRDPHDKHFLISDQLA